MEELQSRHRKEQRDLQSRITQKKKQANKKTRKGVNDECDRLEDDLKLKQQAELAELDDGHVGEGGNASLEVQLEDLTLRADDEGANATRPSTNGIHTNEKQTVEPNGTPDDVGVPSQGKKPNRQKARLARRAAEQEEQSKQAAEEAKNLPDKKQQERDRMLEYMKEHGLREKEIRADGHCLYSAIADQLEQLQMPLGAQPEGKPAVPYKIVRSVAADYIERHQDDFVPFLEEPLSDYLHKVRDTGEWGGQLEIMALAKTYGTNIHVLQDFGRVEKIEPGEDAGREKTMWLAYYKHGFGLGEHYNSLRKAP